MKASAAVLAAVTAAAQALPATAVERTIVERRIAMLNPCAGLQTEQFGQTIGLSELEDVTLREADLSLLGDEITARFAGRLACRTPEGGPLTGNAAANVVAEAVVALEQCRVRSLDITLSEFDGTLGSVLGAFSAQIEGALADEARQLLEEGCRDFVGH